MSDPKESRRVRELVDELRDDLTPGARDWDELEARVMREVGREREELLTEARGGFFSQRAGLAVGVLALAAAAVLYVRGTREESLDQAPAAAVTAAAGSLVASDGAGEVRVGGAAAEAGHALRVGDRIHAERARGLFDRPGRVKWLVDGERSAKVRVERAAETLVLALDEGAVEAQVTPVPSGEAFAVDVTAEGHALRVAVHGTHLRVAREGTRVIVDLTEGVIAFGRPPRSGSTVGTVVSAPAHVEVDVRDLASAKIVREPGAVRAAVDLRAPFETAARPAEIEPSAPPAATPETPPTPTSPTAAGAAPAPPGAASVEAAPRAEPIESVAAAVKACAAARARKSDVKVTLTTKVKLEVRADGSVASARFEPPLMPALQQCAAEAIYRSRLPKTGDVQVSVEYTY